MTRGTPAPSTYARGIGRPTVMPMMRDMTSLVLSDRLVRSSITVAKVGPGRPAAALIARAAVSRPPRVQAASIGPTVISASSSAWYALEAPPLRPQPFRRLVGQPGRLGDFQASALRASRERSIGNLGLRVVPPSLRPSSRAISITRATGSAKRPVGAIHQRGGREGPCLSLPRLARGGSGVITARRAREPPAAARPGRLELARHPKPRSSSPSISSSQSLHKMRTARRAPFRISSRSCPRPATLRSPLYAVKDVPHTTRLGLGLIER